MTVIAKRVSPSVIGSMMQAFPLDIELSVPRPREQRAAAS